MKIKSSNAVIITLIAAVIFGFICYRGLYFSTLGDVGISIISAIMTAILLGLINLAIYLKGAKIKLAKKKIYGYICVGLFTILYLILTIFPFSHYFAVSNNKAIIQQKLNNHINQIDSMFIKYETYANGRGFALNDTLNSHDMSAPHIKSKLYNLQSKLLPLAYSDTVNYTGTKDIANMWIAESKNSENIVKVFKDLEVFAPFWEQKLIILSKYRELPYESNISDFNIHLSISNTGAYFTTVATPSTMAWIFALIIYATFFIAWFFTPTTGIGSDQVASYEIVL